MQKNMHAIKKKLIPLNDQAGTIYNVIWTIAVIRFLESHAWKAINQAYT